MQIITLDPRSNSETPASFTGTNGSTTETNRPTPQVHKSYAEEPKPSGLVSERAANAPRPLKVIYIGAGISGIIAAIKFRDAVPDLDLNVPSHSYQLSFESWTEWSHFFSGAGEILEYWKRVAQKYDVRKHIKFENRCVGARWNDAVGKWFVQMQDLKSGDCFEDSADVLITGTGLLNEWKWPSIPGLQSFKGQLLHSANWDESFDSTDKNITVIGAGSSGIQIVPALVDKINAMDHYVRGRTWISNQHGGSELATRTNDKGGNFQYTEEEKQVWKNDPASYIQYRKELEYRMQTLYSKSQRNSDLQTNSRAQYKADMEHRLRDKPELLDLLLPDFPPLCKRLTPGPGYLEALTSPKVSVITTGIAHVNETGIITVDGKHRPVDAIVCATGFETNSSQGFPILGLCTYGFPNFFQSLGPNSFQGAGNLLIMMEQIHVYVSEVLSKMAYENVGIVEPKRRQVENFTSFAEKYFERTVYSAPCVSWYKSSPAGATLEERKRGRVTALWPGSSLHAVKVLERVRWEDFEIKPYDGNDFGWFGNGWTAGEKGDDIRDENILWYLNQTDFVDKVELEDKEAK